MGGLSLAIMDHGPALSRLDDERLGVAVAGAGHAVHVLDGTPWHHREVMDDA